MHNLCIAKGLESQLNAIANAIGSEGLGGLAIAEKNDSVWYADIILQHKDAFEILAGIGQYASLRNFLEDNNKTLKAYPLFFSQHCMIPAWMRHSIVEMAARRYDTVIVAGFSTQLFRVNDYYQWSDITLVDRLPDNSCQLACEFWKKYLEQAKTAKKTFLQ